jgi:hypothetical protein
VSSLDAAIEAFQASGGSEHLSETYRFRAEARLGLGEVDLALTDALVAMQSAGDHENPDHLGHAWRVLALVALEVGPVVVIGGGEPLGAEQCVEASEETFASSGMQGEFARAVLDHARILEARTETVRADELRETARGIYRRLGLTRLEAAVPAS